MMATPAAIIQAIALLVVANGAPVLSNKILGKRGAWPIDNGFNLRDGQPVFGTSKTWRGLAAAILLSAVAAWLIGLNPLTGALFGALAMVGDLLSSFCKRRMQRRESSRARGIDTIPESLIPIALLKTALAVGWVDVMLVVALFFLIEEFISPLLYRLHIRKRPF
ncbi:MAG: CDP-archaeol synthase [Methylobacter sp.]|nr:CDP-archaeol synthase [Methylobacter sp.]